jgi:hypothetical protein
MRAPRLLSLPVGSYTAHSRTCSVLHGGISRAFHARPLRARSVAGSAATALDAAIVQHQAAHSNSHALLEHS